MAAVLGRTEVGVKEFGRTVTISNDPKARLMYYLDCMCVVLDLSDTANLTRLRNYGQYYLLSEAETDALVSLCFLLSPDELSGKVIFQDDSMCGDSNNSFFEISAVQHNLLLSDSIIIGGQRRHVSKIMAFKQQWLITNWVTPMQQFSPRLARIAAGGAGTGGTQAIEYNQTPQYTAQPVYNRQPQRTYSSDDSCCCTIL
ncbi:uncharacterized protein LOC123559516 [Mercenaria mercenaria]|uniref:uncharacterized protein LOC123559516 n=1 Tax=Mercenaria mercenaria TaxID=6596 RepID=UPI00234F8CA6|nr:uncharacterized protein LOC123559516 [Mercenaria mercenaria]